MKLGVLFEGSKKFLVFPIVGSLAWLINHHSLSPMVDDWLAMIILEFSVQMLVKNN